jgi:hypothetical protein
MVRLLSVWPEKHMERIRWIRRPNPVGGKGFEHHRSEIEAEEEDQRNQTQIREPHAFHRHLPLQICSTLKMILAPHGLTLRAGDRQALASAVTS